MNTPLSQMSGAELCAEIVALEQREEHLVCCFVAEGRGQECPLDTRTKEDALAREYVRTIDRLALLRQERAYRRRYHHSLRPITHTPHDYGILTPART